MTEMTQELAARERLRIYMREYRAKKAAASICLSCTEPALEGRKMCKVHMERARVRNRRSSRLRNLKDSQYVSVLAQLLEERRQATAQFNDAVSILVEQIAEMDAKIASVIQRQHQLVQEREREVGGV